MADRTAGQKEERTLGDKDELRVPAQNFVEKGRELVDVVRATVTKLPRGRGARVAMARPVRGDYPVPGLTQQVDYPAVAVARRKCAVNQHDRWFPAPVALRFPVRPPRSVDLHRVLGVLGDELAGGRVDLILRAGARPARPPGQPPRARERPGWNRMGRTSALLVVSAGAVRVGRRRRDGRPRCRCPWRARRRSHRRHRGLGPAVDLSLLLPDASEPQDLNPAALGERRPESRKAKYIYKAVYFRTHYNDNDNDKRVVYTHTHARPPARA